MASCLLLCLWLTGCWGKEEAPAPRQNAAQSAPDGTVSAPTPDQIRALGVLRPRQTRRLSFQRGGLLRAIAPQIGAKVRQGEQLAALDTTDLTLAQRNAAAAVTIQQAQLTLTEGNPNHTQPEWVIAQAQLQQAQIALDQLALQLDDALLDAPFAGVISAIHAQPGEVVNAGQPVLDLIDTGGWLVETNNVSELNISRIPLGQQATVKVIVLPTQLLTGTVIAIDPVAIVQQGDTTYTLYLDVAPNDLPLLAGMNVEVAMAVAEAK